MNIFLYNTSLPPLLPISQLALIAFAQEPTQLSHRAFLQRFKRSNSTSDLKYATPEEQTSATHRSETEKSPPKSQSPSELLTPPSTSPNYEPQPGHGEVPGMSPSS